jgi:lipopolysaccharide/colanic/teichoic acid biosynthesis glycosyltransferase
MDEIYLQYVHNLNGSSFDHLKQNSKQTVLALFKNNFSSLNDLQKAIVDESSVRVLKFVSGYLNFGKNFQNIVFSTNNSSFIDDVDFGNIKGIINFKKINNLKHINEHFRSVNKLLSNGGNYIGRAEIYYLRKKRIHHKYGRFLGKIVWRFDFLFNRILPQIDVLKPLYYKLKPRVEHPISQAELLGRLVYCGFEILGYQVIDNMFYFTAKKIKEPLDCSPSSGHPLIKLRRIGKGGKLIGVYKFRTMHPYSEYLQNFVIEMYGYNEKGKPANDFRVTEWGKLLRKLWLDEFPQIINVLKGEMKLVGIRPLSNVRFNEFPEDLKEERIRYKPGCFPPYVALCMPDEDGNIEAERIYLNEKAKHPYTTDLKYLWKSVYNIIFNKIRSA